MITAKKKTGIEILLHLLFWTGVLYVLTSLDSRHILIPRNNLIMVSDQYEPFRISTYVYCILFFLAVLFYGNTLWIFPRAIRYKNMAKRLMVCIVWFAMVFGADYFAAKPLFDSANNTFQTPPKEPILQKDEVVKEDIVLSDSQVKRGPPAPDFGSVNFLIGDWKHLQPVILLAFLVILGISIAYFSLKEWNKSELNQTQLRASHLSTEVKFLKSQINPHFLFNTLNNLFSMAQAKGNDDLADGILKLSGMMTYMLNDSNADKVSLKTEINYLEEYITLSKLRYADEEATVRFEYPYETQGITVAPMLFIPFVENAFKHGVGIGRTARIDISIQVREQELLFTCSNPNYSFIKKMEMKKSGIGLENVKRRLALLYPARHELHVISTEEKYIVTLEIQLV